MGRPVASGPIPKTTVPDRRRLFFGLAMDDATRAVVAGHLDEHLVGRIPGKPTPVRNWHVTLRFLGLTDAAAADRVAYEVSRRLGGGGFRARLAGPGAFPRPARAAVLWIGVSRGADEMAALAAQCEEAAIAAGFDPEERPFHPHLTLSRIRPPQNVTALIASIPPVNATFDVTEVTLFESHLGQGPAHYDPVESFPL